MAQNTGEKSAAMYYLTSWHVPTIFGTITVSLAVRIVNVFFFMQFGCACIPISIPTRLGITGKFFGQ